MAYLYRTISFVFTINPRSDEVVNIWSPIHVTWGAINLSTEPPKNSLLNIQIWEIPIKGELSGCLKSNSLSDTQYFLKSYHKKKRWHRSSMKNRMLVQIWTICVVLQSIQSHRFRASHQQLLKTASLELSTNASELVS